jgi:hypothetical protein
MNTKQPFSEEQLGLPNIELIESSEQAFSDAFLRAIQILYRHFEQLKSSIGVNKDFTREPFNLAILGLFSKMSRHYYSYVLLEIHQDWIGSQFLIEHLSEAAITLTYLLEEVDKSIFYKYIPASIQQARYLLLDIEEQLQKFPNHLDLMILRDKLETFIAEQQEHIGDRSFTTVLETHLWGTQEADTIAKHGTVVGLNFLTNPARRIALKIKPASWLDLQLSYLNFFTKSSRSKVQSSINFTYLRDASHLCLHATQAFLEEVLSRQGVNFPDIEDEQQILNLLYEWFYKAHKVYQLHCARIQDRE